MSSPSAPSRILIISNGPGEDSIAAQIATRLEHSVDAYPVVGDGRSFNSICPIVGPRSHVPSQGSRWKRFSLLGDLPAIAASIGPAIGFLRTARARYDKIVVVGDIVGPTLCRLAGLGADLYLDVYKNGYAHSYSRFERSMISRTCKTVFCRDETLAAQLRADGINALCHGNIMMDTLAFAPLDIPPPPDGQPLVGLLPGSRAGAPAIFGIQWAALRAASRDRAIFGALALAPGIDPLAMADAVGATLQRRDTDDDHFLGTLSAPGVSVRLYRGAIGNVIASSEIVLCQSGTVLLQALGSGKPVISFVQAGHRRKRVQDLENLVGEARLVVENNPEAISQALKALLDNRPERERLARIGRHRVGGTGTLEAVINLLADATR